MLVSQLKSVKKQFENVAVWVRAMGGSGDGKGFLKKHSLQRIDLEGVSMGTKRELLSSKVTSLISTRMLTKVENWLSKSVESMPSKLRTALRKCPKNFKVCKIILLDIPSMFEAFIAHAGWDQCELLYHGTHERRIPNVCKDGFKVSPALAIDAGWFGRGLYFSAFPQYAMHHISFGTLPEEGRVFTLIVSYANVGRVRTISAMEMGKPIPDGFDSNHIVVGTTAHDPSGHPYDATKHTHKYDEWIIREGTRVLPRFLITLKCVK
jgi:hypothetical protein